LALLSPWVPSLILRVEHRLDAFFVIGLMLIIRRVSRRGTDGSKPPTISPAHDFAGSMSRHPASASTPTTVLVSHRLTSRRGPALRRLPGWMTQSRCRILHERIHPHRPFAAGEAVLPRDGRARRRDRASIEPRPGQEPARFIDRVDAVCCSPVIFFCFETMPSPRKCSPVAAFGVNAHHGFGNRDA
jgi:hypothetical protein